MHDLTGVCKPPEIRVLGPVAITASGPAYPRHIRRLTELGVFLAFARRPPTPAQVIDAVWPGQHPAAGTRYASLSRLRGWWGVDETGTPYLERHTLAVTGVWSDWGHMKKLAQYAGGIADLSRVSTEDLIAALGLVQGRPFTGATWAEHAWVDPIRTDIEHLVDQICSEVLTRSDSTGPAVQLARRARGLVVPWAQAS